MASRVRVLLADDHQMIAAGLRALLETHFDVLDIVATGSELVEAAARLKPDVIVADITMPEINGIEAVRLIRKTTPDAKIIILTMHVNALFLEEALAAGACGYVLKREAPDVLIEAIRGALSGRIYTPPGLQAISPDPAQKVHPADLTPRQRQVLELLAGGKSLKEIAWELHVSAKTVEFHKYNLMNKVNARSTAELISLAYRRGLIHSL